MPIRRSLVRGSLALLGGLGLVALQVLSLAGLWSAPSGDPESPAPPEIPELMLVALCMAVGATAFGRPLGAKTQTLGAAGMALLVTAAAGDLLVAAGATMIVLVTYLFVWPPGLLLFGVAVLRDPGLPRWMRVFPLAAGVAWLPALIGGWFLGLDVNLTFAPVYALVGATWASMGWVLVRGYAVVAPQPHAWLPVADDTPIGPPR